MNWLAAVLICLSSAEAARYGDYSGAKMPHYNMEYSENAPISDDYKDHSPDTAPSLDYRYEEDLQDKVASTETEDDTWFKQGRRKKKILKLSEDMMDLNTNNDLIPKFKSNGRFQKHRSRTKQNIESENRKHNDYETQYDNDSVDVKIDYPKKVRDNDKVEPEFNFRYTTQKVIRRKVRDRTISQKRRDDSDDDENVREKFDNENLEHRINGRRRMNVEKDPVYIDEMKKLNLKDYVEDNEYYDMKRVNSMRQKIPKLLRRTTVDASATETPSLRPLEDKLYRRVNKEVVTAEIATENVIITEGRIEHIKTTVDSITKVGNQTSNKTDLSLAEKSRLSILRKSLKKESVRNVTWTTKPPVLMQVTPKMQTIVIVEPHNEIQMRARDTFEDSSERVAKAKKLMRHKLVSGARSIQDLTDNWDQMVCDYIDVSLLENSTGCFESNLIFISVIAIGECLLL